MRRYFKGRRRENRWFHLRTTDGTLLAYFRGSNGRFYRYDDGKLVQVAGPPKPMRSYAKK